MDVVTYIIPKWKRNRMGAYVDARVNEQFPLRRPERAAEQRRDAGTR